MPLGELPGVVPREAQPRRERISDEELGNLLAAFGNHEAKALTLLAMQPGQVYSMSELSRRIINLQGEHQGWWRRYTGVPFGYCKSSLAPIGLVTDEVINSDTSTHGFIKTTYGQRVGDPLAGLLLAFSERYPQISLGQLFGRTGSVAPEEEIETGAGASNYKARSPMMRLVILWELTTASLPMRLTDLADRIGKRTEFINHHLEWLAHEGIIDYSSIIAEGSYTPYRIATDFTADEPTPYPDDQALTKKVFTVLFQLSEERFTSEVIYEKIKDVYTHRMKSNLIPAISRVLHHLAEAGYIEGIGFDGMRKSEITLNGDQRALLEELLTSIDGFQNGDSEIRQSGQHYAQVILADPQRVAQLLLKAKESSSAAHKQTSKITAQIVTSILGDHPDLTVRQLVQHYEELEGRPLSTHGIYPILNFLRDEGVIKSTEARIPRWSLAASGNSPEDSDQSQN